MTLLHDSITNPIIVSFSIFSSFFPFSFIFFVFFLYCFQFEIFFKSCLIQETINIRMIVIFLQNYLQNFLRTFRLRSLTSSSFSFVLVPESVLSPPHRPVHHHPYHRYHESCCQSGRFCSNHLHPNGGVTNHQNYHQNYHQNFRQNFRQNFHSSSHPSRKTKADRISFSPP